MNPPVTASEVRDYLNHLSNLKRTIKKPFEVSIDEETGLHFIYDADNKLVLILSEKLYEMMQEL